MGQEKLEFKNFNKELEYFETLKPLAEVISNYGFFTLKIDPKAETFSFNHQTREITVSPQLVEKLNLEKEEKKYIFLHEIGHLIQLFQDKESYLESFEISKEKSKKNPLLKMAYHHFFNVFFDLHANSIIKRRMPLYQKGERLEGLPKNLYQEKAFPKTNYSSEPYSMQFLYYFLRKVMVPDQEIKIDEKVEKEIKQKIYFFDKEYSNLEEFVNEQISNPLKTTKDLMFNLKEFLLPIFEKLLEMDEKEGKLKEIPEILGEFDMDGDLSEEVIEEIAREIEEAKKGSSQKYKEKMREKQKEWAKGKGFSEEEIHRWLEIQERTVKEIESLEELWNNFVQKSIEIEINKKGTFRTGAAIIPEELVQQLPILLTQPSEAKIFARQLPEIKGEEIKPKKINLFLIVDLSGSMDEEKRKAVQEVAYALNKSLINFYRNGLLQMADTGQKFPISIDYQILGFGDSLVELTERTEKEKKERKKEDTPEKNLDEELLRAIFKIANIDLGGTQDDLALKKVKETITPEIKEELEKNNEIIIALEITDGETATSSESKKLVKDLNSIKNVYCRAIQIPGPIYSEKKPEKIPEREIVTKEILPPTGTFKEVWTEKFGRRLKNLGVLKETMIAILYDALTKNL